MIYDKIETEKPDIIGCKDCVQFRKANWETKNEISRVNFSMYPSPCQCKCIYCNVNKGKFELTEEIKELVLNNELVKRMIEEGHIVGNHTVNHPSMPEVTNDEKLKKEIMDLHDYVKENFDYEMTFLRPPKGEYSERTVKISLDLGYRTVLWSCAYDDWDVNKQGRLEYAKGMILNNLHNGCVMLLHAVSKDNTELLGEIIDETRNGGYEFVSLEEFVY